MDPVLTSGSGLNIAGLALCLTMCVALLLVPRRYVAIPIFVLVCYMTMGDRLIVSGLNFTMVRILLLFGWLRIVFKREYLGVRFNLLDGVVFGWTLVRTINYALVWGTSSALINRLGYAYDILGAYCLFRCVIKEPADVYRAIRYLAAFVGPLAVLMALEKITQQNPFASFGGVPLNPEVRDGIVRCQGPFAHPILAGTFGATSLPLFLALWRNRVSMWLLVSIASASALVIAFVAGSSGPALACVAGIVGLVSWVARRYMRFLFSGLLLFVVLLQVMMSSPIWFAMGRFSVFSGSTGWYRGFLIDMAIRHIGDWWLVGTTAAESWHPFLIDVTNQYVAEGFNGGLLALGLFVGILIVCFRAIGRVARTRIIDLKSRHLVWALGASLFAHALSFTSVSYFDQNFVVLYFLLASISVCAVGMVRVPRREVRSTLHGLQRPSGLPELAGAEGGVIPNA